MATSRGVTTAIHSENRAVDAVRWQGDPKVFCKWIDELGCIPISLHPLPDITLTTDGRGDERVRPGDWIIRWSGGGGYTIASHSAFGYLHPDLDGRMSMKIVPDEGQPKTMWAVPTVRTVLLHGFKSGANEWAACIRVAEAFSIIIKSDAAQIALSDDTPIAAKDPNATVGTDNRELLHTLLDQWLDYQAQVPNALK